LTVALFSVPFIEITEDGYSFGSGCPLNVFEMIIDSVDAELEVALSDFVKASFAVELSDFGFSYVSKFLEKMLSYGEKYLMGLEIRVVLDDLKGLCFGVHEL
jgi:hypothetical protein